MLTTSGELDVRAWTMKLAFDSLPDEESRARSATRTLDGLE
jgi:hypothetical protein